MEKASPNNFIKESKLTIVQVRGTSGSGKTWAMRETMKLLKATYGDPNPVLVHGRKRPLYYQYLYDGRKVSVMGSYEEGAACGGVDTISGYELLVSTVTQLVKEGNQVLMEGLLLSEDTKQTLTLSEVDEVRCIFLVTPIEKCIEQIKQRRAAKGNDKPLNEDNTRRRVATIQRARLKLEEANIMCRGSVADQVPKIVLAWLTNSPYKHKIKMGSGREYYNLMEK